MKAFTFMVMILFLAAALLGLIGSLVYIMYHTDSKFLVGTGIFLFLSWILLQVASAMRRGH